MCKLALTRTLKIQDTVKVRGGFGKVKWRAKDSKAMITELVNVQSVKVKWNDGNTQIIRRSRVEIDRSRITPLHNLRDKLRKLERPNDEDHRRSAPNTWHDEEEEEPPAVEKQSDYDPTVGPKATNVLGASANDTGAARTQDGTVLREQAEEQVVTPAAASDVASEATVREPADEEEAQAVGRAGGEEKSDSGADEAPMAPQPGAADTTPILFPAEAEPPITEEPSQAAEPESASSNPRGKKRRESAPAPRQNSEKKLRSKSETDTERSVMDDHPTILIPIPKVPTARAEPRTLASHLHTETTAEAGHRTSQTSTEATVTNKNGTTVKCAANLDEPPVDLVFLAPAEGPSTSTLGEQIIREESRSHQTVENELKEVRAELQAAQDWLDTHKWDDHITDWQKDTREILRYRKKKSQLSEQITKLERELNKELG